MPTVTTNGVETYYERRGEGPPVVFVHGAVTDHRTWTSQASALADEYTTVAYDLRGHGRTGGSGVSRYTPALLAADLHELVDALDLDRPVLCGLSLGGMVAQAYATAHPRALRGLVLADTFSSTTFGWRERLQLGLMRAAVPAVRLVGLERVEAALVRLQELRHRGVSGEYGRLQELRAEGPGIQPGEFGKVVGALRAFFDEPLDLSKVEVPALVLYGERDLPLIRDHAAVLARELPDADVEVVPGAGHASNLDNPDAFTATVRGFLERIAEPEPRTD